MAFLESFPFGDARPFCALDILLRVSSLFDTPFIVSLVFFRVSSDITRPFRDALNFALVSSDKGLP